MPKLTEKEGMTPIDRKCLEAGISRLELSRRSGVSARTLEAWGKRLRIPRDVYQLNKVAKALGCHIEDLIEPELAEAANESKGDGPDQEPSPATLFRNSQIVQFGLQGRNQSLRFRQLMPQGLTLIGGGAFPFTNHLLRQAHLP